MDLSEAGSQGASPTNFIQDEAPPLTSQTSEEVKEEGGDLENEITAALKLRKERKVSKDQEKPTKKSQRGDDRSESVSSQGGMGVQGKSGVVHVYEDVVFVCAHKVTCFGFPSYSAFHLNIFTL